MPPRLEIGFEVQFLHLKLSNSSGSSSNIKSDGNLLMFALTALFKYFVSTPYKRAKSLSIIICWPRIHESDFQLASELYYRCCQSYFLPKGHSIQVAFFQRYSSGPWVCWRSHRQHRAYWTAKMAMPTKTLPVIPICRCSPQW